MLARVLVPAVACAAEELPRARRILRNTAALLEHQAEVVAGEHCSAIAEGLIQRGRPRGIGGDSLPLVVIPRHDSARVLVVISAQELGHGKVALLSGRAGEPPAWSVHIEKADNAAAAIDPDSIALFCETLARDSERRRARRVARVGIEATRAEHSEHLDVAAEIVRRTRGQVQCVPPLIIARLRVSTMCEQRRDVGRIHRRNEERGLIVAIARIDLRAMLEQQRDRGRVISMCHDRVVQRSAAITVTRLHLCTMPKQHRNGSRVFCIGHERCFLTKILRIDRRSTIDERIDHGLAAQGLLVIDETLLARRVQRGAAVFEIGIDDRSPLDQKSDDIRMQSLRRGMKRTIDDHSGTALNGVDEERLFVRETPDRCQIAAARRRDELIHHRLEPARPNAHEDEIASGGKQHRADEHRRPFSADHDEQADDREHGSEDDLHSRGSTINDLAP